MSEFFMVGLAAIIFLGILAQWISWRLRLPSILLLLIFGFLSGPVFHLVKPDRLFGDLLFPVVSFSVAVILFEGGLSLRLSELKSVGKVVRNMISVGILVTWFLSTAGAYFLLKLDFTLALLFGAILVVTGPTVILPILREVRPKGQLNSILKWEGIMNDPIGAILAVLVFESILAAGLPEATAVAVTGLIKTVVLGGAIGLSGAYIIIVLLKYRLVPDYLQNPISLMMVFCVFAASNLIQAESGLFAVTLMGIYLANQKRVAVRHIIEFKENLRVLLISVLFIILAARLSIQELKILTLDAGIFLLLLLFVVRPASVLVSTIGTKISWQEKVFLSWMAPRGIVAAAVTSLFAIELGHAGLEQARELVPLIFLIIIGTISAYGLSAVPLARWLKIANPNPQGVLILGAHDCARLIAKLLKEKGYKVLMVDTNWPNISAARMEGIQTYYGSILSERILDDIDLTGIGRLIALTPNQEVNSLAALYFSRIFGKDEVYQLAIEADETRQGKVVSQELRGQMLFGANFSYSYLTSIFQGNSKIKTTLITEEFDFKTFLNQHQNAEVIPLFLMGENGNLWVYTDTSNPTPGPGQKLISLINYSEKAPGGEET